MFRQTLLRTYEETRDCPEVSDVRTADEIIAGHQAQGTVPPEGWWLALDGAQPVGVTLLVQLIEGDWEIVYTGVVPEARRRGFGREMLARALNQARAGGAEQLTLSVDGRNTPAWDLYRSAGFTAVDRRAVYLAVWRS